MISEFMTFTGLRQKLQRGAASLSPLKALKGTAEAVELESRAQTRAEGAAEGGGLLGLI